ncbi:hypothetical protein [Jannaschia sp. M317]|uniref:hypothetical protein n=1 Tax=Jannaschia sp. M317 TaxID=2867011 RepID=UPI0021A36642|nr:hypothetical protein [Jannaschia sp. M317]UWQ16541.1 hypothetical protein K3551_11510 [Jannaschia sp. M317]
MAHKPGQSADDPKALIHEAYRMEGIGMAECRTIFLDWALSFGGETGPAIDRLLTLHDAPDHPMTEVLREGQASPARTGRRGGRAARLG